MERVEATCRRPWRKKPARTVDADVGPSILTHGNAARKTVSCHNSIPSQKGSGVENSKLLWRVAEETMVPQF
jgi:hypothetical protein